MYRRILGIVVFAAICSLMAAAQFSGPAVDPAHGGSAHRRKATLVPMPTPPPPPETVDALPLPLAPLTQADLPPQPPRVNYHDGILTVDSQNSTLGDILVAIHQATGAEFDPMPEVTERTAIHLSGSASEVVSSLLRGSEFGYVLVSSPEDEAILQKVFLTVTEKTGSGSHIVQARAAAPRSMPAPSPEAMAAAASLDATPPAEPTSSAASAATLPARDAASTTPAAAPPAPVEESQPTTQQGIVLPDPIQVAERVNQQNRDQQQSPVSAAGQYMQELYRLRLQQNQASSTQPGAAPAQQ